jgi:hypothetical protein
MYASTSTAEFTFEYLTSRGIETNNINPFALEIPLRLYQEYLAEFKKTFMDPPF